MLSLPTIRQRLDQAARKTIPDSPQALGKEHHVTPKIRRSRSAHVYFRSIVMSRPLITAKLGRKACRGPTDTPHDQIPEGYALVRPRAKQDGVKSTPTEGKTVYRGAFQAFRLRPRTKRCVYQVIERTIAADGQILLIPDIEVAPYWTSLSTAPDDVLLCYFGSWHAGTVPQRGQEGYGFKAMAV